MEQHVRVTISGPVLATLILAGWLELQGAPEAQAAEENGASGTIELFSETAEYWLDLPCTLVYDIAAAPGTRKGTLAHLVPPEESSNGTQVATYLLQHIIGGHDMKFSSGKARYSSPMLPPILYEQCDDGIYTFRAYLFGKVKK